MILASSSLSMIGNGRTSWRQLSGDGASRSASGPTVEPRASYASSSRIVSSGGLATWANSWEKVVEQQSWALAEHRDRGVGAHRADLAARSLAVGATITFSSSWV